jgi:hypothetical protein
VIYRARRRLFTYAAESIADRRAFRFLEDVVDLLAMEGGVDADVELEWFAALRTFYRWSCIERTSSTPTRLPVANIPFAERFAIAMESGFPLRPDLFFAAFRFDDWTTVAKEADEAGKTALHWAIANYGGCQRHHEPNRYTPDVISSYANLVIELIRNGADVYACWDDSSRLSATAKTGPLLALLDALGKDGDWHAAIISDAVYRWGQMLVESGKSLTNYVVTENEFLRANRHGITFSYGRYEIFVVGLEILADNRLTVRVEHTFEVSVWRARPTRMPGAWPSPLRLEDQIMLSPELPSIIIWRPDDADEQEGFRWVSAEAVKTGMHSYLVEPLDTTESHALDFISLRDPQVPGTRHFAPRDDHSLSVVMRTNESR